MMTKTNPENKEDLKMRNRTPRSRLVVLAVVATLGFAPVAGATVPAVVEGQPVPTLAPLIKRVAPAVVNVATRKVLSAPENPLLAEPFFRRFFGLPPAPRQRQVRAVGSGVIIDAEKGYVLTNNHVVANADEVRVTLRDQRHFKAKVVGADPQTDIALLQIPAEHLTALPLGDSDKLEVGDFVVAIGNPFGIGQTVTSGIVSALRRSGLGIEGFENFIQTDASINPGNSGGALVTLRGKLIGINTAIIGPAGGNVGIGFAIPINMAREVVAHLIRYGKVRRGLLGVQLQNVTPDIAEALGLPESKGALIAGVMRGSPADEAGIEPGDVVVAVNGKAVRDAAELRNTVGLMRVGEKVTLAVLRDGKRLTIEATIGKPREETVLGKGPAQRLGGATFAPVQESPNLAGRIEGVWVKDVEPGSPARQIGLRPGDVIVAVNRERVRSLDDFKQAVNATRGALALRIVRGNAQLFIVVR